MNFGDFNLTSNEFFYFWAGWGGLSMRGVELTMKTKEKYSTLYLKVLRSKPSIMTKTHKHHDECKIREEH